MDEGSADDELDDAWEDCSSEDEDDETCISAKHLKLKKLDEVITFKRLLQHFAVATNQKHSSMTLFLRLFKHHQPKVDYEDLPSTGATLLKVDGRDFGRVSGSVTRDKKMPLATRMGNGKYVHFGLENGVAGDSPGVVFQKAGLLQYVAVYKEHPLLLPTSIREKVGKLIIIHAMSGNTLYFSMSR